MAYHVIFRAKSKTGATLNKVRVFLSCHPTMIPQLSALVLGDFHRKHVFIVRFLCRKDQETVLSLSERTYTRE
jgi:hypothetical protein